MQKCWECKHFAAVNRETSLAGWCRREAPRGFDFTARNITNQECFRIDFGYMDPTLTGGVVLPLKILGPPALDDSCHATDATGFNADDIIPASILNNYYPCAIQVAASRFNSGAASVGTPVLKVQGVQVLGDSQTQLFEASITIPAAYVGINGAATDNFHSTYMDITGIDSTAGGLFGMRLDLTGTTADDVAQIRQFKAGIVFKTFNNPVVGDTYSKEKYAAITDATAQGCGQFVRLIGTIPTIPTT